MASKIRVYGQAQNLTALGIIHAYMKLYPEATIEDLRNAFPDALSPDKGVAEIFIDADTPDADEHYFTSADEVIETADGKRVAMAKLWTKPSYDNLVRRAADYDIEVAEFEHQQQVGKKGSYYIEYVNGFVPSDEVETVQQYEESKMKRGCLGWLWVLLGIFLIFLIALFIGKCCSKDDTVVPAGEITETAIIVDEAGEGAQTGANSVAGQNAGTDASSVNSSTGAAVSDATGAATAKATGNTGTCTTAPAEAVAQIEKYQKQFDAIEYPVGEYQLKPEAKAILDNVARIMKENPGMKITVNGYASREGNPQANQVLSDKRAATVVDYLVSKGVAPDCLKASGLNTSDPISKELSPNRRIDFVVE